MNMQFLPGKMKFLPKHIDLVLFQSIIVCSFHYTDLKGQGLDDIRHFEVTGHYKSIAREIADAVIIKHRHGKAVDIISLSR